MRPKYDTVDGIKSYLTDLAGLHQLIADRREAYSKNKEGARLNEFLILGHWRADSCGNFGRTTFELDYGSPPKDWTFPRSALPVVRAEDLWSHLGSDQKWSCSTNMRSDLPHPHLLCAECGKGWTLENAHDAIQHTEEDKIVPLTPGKSIAEREVDWKDKTDGMYRFGYEPSVRNEKYIDMTPHPKYKGDFVNQGGWRHQHAAFNTKEGYGERVTRNYIAEPGDEASITVFVYEHTRCQAIRKARQEREFFTDVFVKAGMPNVLLNEIPNQYWRAETSHQVPPWFIARLPYGDIKIGWRKRVISIDWSSTKCPLYQLFRDEEVTKDSYSIHAWGKDKAVEYLKKIHGALA